MLDLCRATTYPGDGLDLDYPIYMINDLRRGGSGQINVGVTTYGFSTKDYYNSLYNYYAVRPELEFDNLEELTNGILSGELSSIGNGYLKGTVYLPSKYVSREEQQQLAELYENGKLEDTKTIFPTNQALHMGQIYGIDFLETNHPIYGYNGNFYLFYNMKRDDGFWEDVKLKNGKMTKRFFLKKYDFNFIKIEPRELLIDSEGKLAIFQDLVFAGIMYKDLPMYFPLFVQGLKNIKRLVEKSKAQKNQTEKKPQESNKQPDENTNGNTTNFHLNYVGNSEPTTNNELEESGDIAEKAESLRKQLYELLEENEKLTNQILKNNKKITNTFKKLMEVSGGSDGRE